MEVKIKPRVQSIDILRGSIMVIMALDHVRDYFHIYAVTDNPTNLATTTPILFFTRWITHFCAPTFLFLSGISACLAGRSKTKKELSIFLIKRGLWLVFAEVTLVTLALTFDPLYNTIYLLVFWSIGMSMIILGLLVLTNPTVIIITGAIILLGHNIFDYIKIPADGTGGKLFNYFVAARASVISLGGGRNIIIAYMVVPCAAVMLLGYGAGQLYNAALFTPEKRRKILLVIGTAAIALFIILRLINQYGDPSPWLHQKSGTFTFLSFLNASKSPMSLDFLCMTLGPSILVLALTEQVQNKFTAFVTVYGKTPFFYFVIHLYLIHILCIIFFFASGHTAKDIKSPDAEFFFRPAHYGFPLWVVYLVWVFVVLVLYKPCKWFNKYRSTHSQWWLKYI